ncbi:hypothetical protein N7449_008512 [Penicillium cf. viridicatum]|uniref:Uncharacterized protein n=1 Tax=Penicillium cf. viridicatum TaxID=2972119 RepID=A0A9W9M7R2_9EURO|nr:hypothetical protein N7449_008512 [Penicillium cf. viridicatum]
MSPMKHKGTRLDVIMIKSTLTRLVDEFIHGNFLAIQKHSSTKSKSKDSSTQHHATGEHHSDNSPALHNDEHAPASLYSEQSSDASTSKSVQELPSPTASRSKTRILTQLVHPATGH